MRRTELFLLRGLPGSGKTYLAETFPGRAVAFAADDFFMDEAGKYQFDPEKLPEAHAQCREKTAEALAKGKLVVVHNTFSSRWELEPYLQMDSSRVVVVDVYDGGCTDEELAERNSHGVPLEVIQRMRGRWEHDWKNGNPLPPWERPKGFWRTVRDWFRGRR